jgi:glutamine amidotransferase
MISIINYGMGNLGSILNMFRKLGIDAQCVEATDDVAAASHLVLPGIGAFDACVSALDRSGLREATVEAAMRGVPLLGICVGMQLLGRSSDEGPGRGLGLIPARTRRIVTADSRLKVPHMGWNVVTWRRQHPITESLAADSRFYFVHSYHVECEDPRDVLGSTVHGIELTAAISHANIVGVQFHPEKSHRFGLQLLKNFSTL